MTSNWRFQHVRDKFFSYYKENHHVQLLSTPVTPYDDPTEPLFYSCMNRLKGALSRVQLDMRHPTCYSMRCICTSGDEEDLLDRFRNDSSYHRMSEILGCWSYGDYFKEGAIDLALNLLREIYELPESRICATFFCGDTTSLDPDDDSKLILQKYLEEDKVFPSMSKSDFWMAGDTGLCGPCVGIFYDCSDSQEGVSSGINMNDGKFVELCRIVFVQFNRQSDGVLDPLEANHVFTWIDVECLAAILQDKKSHYDLDVMSTIISAIQCGVGTGIEPYSGKFGSSDTYGLDMAYRLLADHMRMICAATARNSQLGLGNEGREYLLKSADKLAMQYGHQVLQTDQDTYHFIVLLSLQSDDLCPELQKDGKRMGSIIDDEEKIYKKNVKELLDQKLQSSLDMSAKKRRKQGVKNNPSNVTEDIPPIVWFETRVIEFSGRLMPIVLKNKDTRCSLVTLCNVLLLQGKITLNLDVKKVSQDHLIYLVQRCLLYDNIETQLQLNLELPEFQKQVLGVLPKLTESLYFDVSFDSTHAFEYTPETALFGFLGVPLHHGWLVDPQEVQSRVSICTSSYFVHSRNLAVYESKLSDLKSGTQNYGEHKQDDEFYAAIASSMVESEVFSSTDSIAMVSTFLRGSQLTPYGLSCLLDDLKEREPSVLIWNERLVTIIKVKDKIYVLLNDVSLLTTETNVVWERLTQVDDYGFVDCFFVPTDSDIKSTLPFTKKERKKMSKKAKENLGLKVLSVPEEPENDEKTEKKVLSVPNEKTERKEHTHDKVEKAEDKEEEKAEDKAISVRERLLERCVVLMANVPPQTLSIKKIDFFGCSTHVIYQIKDGPCALIAICNALLLKGKIEFAPLETEVSVDHLLNLILIFLSESMEMEAHSSEVQRQIYDVLPTLATGFDVDVVFNRADGFTMTPEWMLLDCLGIPIRHGWVADELLSGVSSLSFERLSLSLSATEPDFPDAEMAKKFLKGPQLTHRGLVSLCEDLVENIPCILYMNHHYSTIIKIHGALHTLVTDSSYSRTGVVWQTLEVEGTGSYLDSSFRTINSGLDIASLSDNLQGPCFVLETWTPPSTNPDPGEDISPKEYVKMSDPQIVPDRGTPRASTSSRNPNLEDYLSLEEFLKMPGNHFSELKTIFAHGTPVNVVDTTKVGRVFGLNILEDIVSSHLKESSWNGQYDLSTISVTNQQYAEIRAPYCPEFNDDAVANDFLTYINEIVELFRIKGELPPFFKHLANLLSNPPRKPEICNQFQLDCFYHKLHGFWDVILTTLALRSSMTRAGLFSGIHRIRNVAPSIVKHTLKTVLSNAQLPKDWRFDIAAKGHPILKNVLRRIPVISGTKGSKKDDNEDKTEDGKVPGETSATSGSKKDDNENKTEDGCSINKGKKVDTKFGRFSPDGGSLSIFPRQVNEHPKSKEDRPESGNVKEEPFKKLSELDLLSSVHLEGSLPFLLEALLTYDDIMTVELWEWFEEVLEEYCRPETLTDQPWLRTRGTRRSRRH